MGQDTTIFQLSEIIAPYPTDPMTTQCDINHYSRITLLHSQYWMLISSVCSVYAEWSPVTLNRDQGEVFVDCFTTIHINNAVVEVVFSQWQPQQLCGGPARPYREGRGQSGREIHTTALLYPIANCGWSLRTHSGARTITMSRRSTTYGVFVMGEVQDQLYPGVVTVLGTILSNLDV